MHKLESHTLPHQVNRERILQHPFVTIDSVVEDDPWVFVFNLRAFGFPAPSV